MVGMLYKQPFWRNKRWCNWKVFYYGETIFYSHLDLANGYKVDQNLKNKVSMSVDFFNSALLRRIMTFIE